MFNVNNKGIVTTSFVNKFKTKGKGMGESRGGGAGKGGCDICLFV